MAMVYDTEGNLTLLDGDGTPRVRMGSSLDWGDVKHIKRQPFKQPPKSTGYTSLIGLHSDYQILQDLPDVPDLFVYAAEVSDRIVGFGNINIEYILSNLKDYKYLLSKLRNNPHVYRLALTQLISINIYKEYLNEPYNLPSVLSRSQIEQRHTLLEYLKQSKLMY